METHTTYYETLDRGTKIVNIHKGLTNGSILST